MPPKVDPQDILLTDTVCRTLGMTERDRQALAGLGLRHAADLLAWRPGRHKKLKGQGSRFLLKIPRIQQRMREYLDDLDGEEHRLEPVKPDWDPACPQQWGDYYARPADPQRLLCFPFFSGYAQALRRDRIHRSYCPDMPVADLPLPLRARKVIESLPDLRLGDLLVQTRESLLKNPNFGVKSVYEIRRAIRRHLFFDPAADCIDLDRSASLEQVLADYARTVLDERSARVVISRFGWDAGTLRTLQAVGDIESMSREGVRRMVRRSLLRLAHPHHLRRLDPLRRVVRDLADPSVALPLPQFELALCRTCGWPRPRDPQTLPLLLGWFDDLAVSETAVRVNRRS